MQKQMAGTRLQEKAGRKEDDDEGLDEKRIIAILFVTGISFWVISMFPRLIYEMKMGSGDTETLMQTAFGLITIVAFCDLQKTANEKIRNKALNRSNVPRERRENT